MQCGLLLKFLYLIYIKDFIEAIFGKKMRHFVNFLPLTIIIIIIIIIIIVIIIIIFMTELTFRTFHMDMVGKMGFKWILDGWFFQI